MLEITGWIGATMFSFCALPQVIKTWQTKRATDFSWLFLLMWFVGEILTFVYVAIKTPDAYPLLVNYAFNFVMLCYLIYVKVKYDA